MRQQKPATPHHTLCIATKQEVGNLLALRAIGATHVISLVSDHAAKQGWPDNLEAALGHAVEFQRLPLPRSYESDPTALADWLVAQLPVIWPFRGDLPVSVVWSGGQKPTAVGVWNAFAQLCRDEPGTLHSALYPDPNRGTLLRWDGVGAAAIHQSLNPAIDLRSLLRAQGYEVTRTERLLPTRADAEEHGWLRDPHLAQAEALFRTHQPYRKLCFELAATGGGATNEMWGALEELDKHKLQTTLRQTLLGRDSRAVWDNFAGQAGHRASLRAALETVGVALPWLANQVLRQAAQTLRQSIVVPNDQAILAAAKWRSGDRIDGRAKVVGGDYASRFPYMLEKIIARRIVTWARTSAHVRELHANVEVAKCGQDERAGELDILLITTTGRPIMLDVKSYFDDAKTRRAQESTVRDLGGVFARRVVVIPHHRADLSMPWYPTKLLELVERRRPSELILLGDDPSFEAALDALCSAT